MYRLTIIILFFCTSSNMFSQEIPEVKVNHLSFVLKPQDLKAFNESSFVKDTLTAREIIINKTNNQITSTATYIFGPSTYLELFDASENDANLGFVSIGFSVDQIGELDTLKNLLRKTYFTQKNNRFRTIDSIKVPWFDVLVVNDLSLMDSAFMAQLHFWFWIMEYKAEYFEYNKFPIEKNKLTRENYLAKYASEIKNKIVKRFSGIVMKLNPAEKEYLTKFFNVIGYERLNQNEYITSDNFKFLFKDRLSGDQNSLESIKFETTENFLSK